ncbi:MAG: NADH-quinone oxidoreductase subunit K [Chloroflexia bacterium]|nr:NADH-quinone oxidoreductase subunit K [Chloroflexia bacterium]
MILALSLGVAVLFGAGSYLMLKHDLIRLIIGMVLISNAANLFIMSAGLTTGAAPIYPLGGETSDPLVQAMTLTAIVISFAVTALVLSLAWRVYVSHLSVDIRELSRAEELQADRDDEVGQPDSDELGAPYKDSEGVRRTVDQPPGKEAQR